VSEKPKRPWYQFSFKTLFAVTLLSSCVVGLISRERLKAARQQEAVDAIRRIRGEIGWDDDALNRPLWLRFIFGDDKFGNAAAVSFRTDNTPSDGTLARLGNLTKLKYLSLNRTNTSDSQLVHVARIVGLERLFLEHTQVTDSGLVHLNGLTSLRDLFLDDTRITDAGLMHLAGIKKLECLSLYGTDVTDNGLAQLAALHGLVYLNLKGTLVTDAGVRKLQNELPHLTIER
jgi:hypothetical protein